MLLIGEVLTLLMPRDADADVGLLGLGIRPGEQGVDTPLNRRRCRKAAPPEDRPDRKPTKDEVILTLRRDLIGLRKAILAKASRRELLHDIDYAVDQLDNVLGEM